MRHWAHWEPDKILFAKALTAALEARGLSVFPNSATAGHLDGKVAQKYLLSSPTRLRTAMQSSDKQAAATAQAHAMMYTSLGR